MRKVIATKLRQLADWLDPALFMCINFDEDQMAEIKRYVDDSCREALANVVGNIRIHT